MPFHVIPGLDALTRTMARDAARHAGSVTVIEYAPTHAPTHPPTLAAARRAESTRGLFAVLGLELGLRGLAR